ncbi:MAG: hypothetical protein F4Y01_02375 [Gammaproteobacteria bacterium]|nr:hypothetical protein [Gammaproteobacteria bacterium]
MNQSIGRGIVRRRPDGYHIVAFERPVHHSVERVWSAITAPEERAVWAPGIRFDPAPDARFDIWFGDECEGPSHVSGHLSNFHPPRSIALGSISIELARPDGRVGSSLARTAGLRAPVGCVIHFSDVLWFDNKRTKVDFANAVLAGWHRFLDTLEIWLNEGRPALDLPEPDYARAFVEGRDSLGSL